MSTYAHAAGLIGDAPRRRPEAGDRVDPGVESSKPFATASTSQPTVNATSTITARRIHLRQNQARRRASTSSSRNSAASVPNRLGHGIIRRKRTSTKPRNAITAAKVVQERPAPVPAEPFVDVQVDRRRGQQGDHRGHAARACATGARAPASFFTSRGREEGAALAIRLLDDAASTVLEVWRGRASRRRRSSAAAATTGLCT